jgi:hypothetical protein
MARTTTRILDINKLTSTASSNSLVLKLMICCNDLSLSNQSLARWREESNLNIDEKYRKKGAGMYFVRLQLAHLFEGITIIEAIKNDDHLSKFISTLDTKTTESFSNLISYTKGGNNRKIFEELIGTVRNTLTFHYDHSSKLVTRSLNKLTEISSCKTYKITRGNNAYRWYFNFGDDVVNHLVVRELWKIPDDENSDHSVDELVSWAHGIFLSFMDFSGEFIWKYFDNKK